MCELTRLAARPTGHPILSQGLCEDMPTALFFCWRLVNEEAELPQDALRVDALEMRKVAQGPLGKLESELAAGCS